MRKKRQNTIYIGDIVAWKGAECIVTNVNRGRIEIHTEGSNRIVSVAKKDLEVVSPVTNDWLQMECEGTVWFDPRHCVNQTIYHMLKSCKDVVVKNHITSDKFCLKAKLRQYFEKHPVSDTEGLHRHIDLLKRYLVRFYQDRCAPL